MWLISTKCEDKFRNWERLGYDFGYLHHESVLEIYKGRLDQKLEKQYFNCMEKRYAHVKDSIHKATNKFINLLNNPVGVTKKLGIDTTGKNNQYTQNTKKDESFKNKYSEKHWERIVIIEKKF